MLAQLIFTSAVDMTGSLYGSVSEFSTPANIFCIIGFITVISSALHLVLIINAAKQDYNKMK